MNWALAISLLLAGTVAASGSENPVFDLFGRPVDPAHLNPTGMMPPGELKLVIEPPAPRFRAKRRKARVARKPSEPPTHRVALAARASQSVINVDQAIFATHLEKSGNRLILRHY